MFVPPLFAALVLALAAPTAPAAKAFGLEKSGWTLVTASDDTFVYMKAAASPEKGVRRVWTAYDSDITKMRETFAFRSVESLAEFDCGRRLSRVVDETFHAAPGLTGQTWKMPDFVATPWVSPAPDSIGAIRMAYACRTLSET